VLAGEVRACWRDGLKLDESPKLLDLIEMDAHALPQQQMATLGDDPAYANRGGERRTQRRTVVDLDDPVAALSLLRSARALELDQVRTTGLLLAELEPAARNLEVGIALRDRAAVLGPERPAYLKRRGRVRVDRLQLNVSARCLHNGRSRSMRLGPAVGGAL
jgi:hypothetical protein